MATVQLANLLHQAVGFEEDADDALVVVEVFVRQGFAGFRKKPVFEPFLSGLITTDIKVPGDVGDIAKILRVVEIDAAQFALSDNAAVAVGRAETARFINDVFDLFDLVAT